MIILQELFELMGNNGFVIGIDVEIREHNRVEIEAYSIYKCIKMIKGL
jgi:hypothetical protein